MKVKMEKFLEFGWKPQCKQDVVDLLMLVQTGDCSCRKASDILFPQFGPKGSFVVLRKPCLQEDEGRSFYIGKYASREIAEAKIKSEVGYFKESDYEIIG